jgi:hypothetical protein
LNWTDDPAAEHLLVPVAAIEISVAFSLWGGWGLKLIITYTGECTTVLHSLFGEDGQDDRRDWAFSHFNADSYSLAPST